MVQPILPQLWSAQLFRRYMRELAPLAQPTKGADMKKSKGKGGKGKKPF
jgi:hypothetical protein